MKSRSGADLFTIPQQVLPLTEIALKAHAFPNAEARNDAPLDLLAGLSGSFARSVKLPPGLIMVRNKLVATQQALIEVGQQPCKSLSGCREDRATLRAPIFCAAWRSNRYAKKVDPHQKGSTLALS